MDTRRSWNYSRRCVVFSRCPIDIFGQPCLRVVRMALLLTLLIEKQKMDFGYRLESSQAQQFFPMGTGLLKVRYGKQTISIKE